MLRRGQLGRGIGEQPRRSSRSSCSSRTRSRWPWASSSARRWAGWCRVWSTMWSCPWSGSSSRSLSHRKSC